MYDKGHEHKAENKQTAYDAVLGGMISNRFWLDSMWLDFEFWMQKIVALKIPKMVTLGQIVYRISHSALKSWYL